MGGILSCIRSALQTIGSCIMAVISGIGGILQAIISGIVSFCGIIVSFLTCGYCGGRRKHGGARTRRSHV
ncbi:Major facilitator superfamily domain, general substrate transporter [Purpureocillium lavendulum]|uniref:Major facilitator superfamily domain, general substrate transporter n=1 Tax=Purpureocillium lavendulum TaxID=1247861 RepID=A0AB34FYC9_9HYPO|nr:Major facilitator superfamily domain, general substrate transporter [Purpureocillium lavendulum]